MYTFCLAKMVKFVTWSFIPISEFLILFLAPPWLLPSVMRVLPCPLQLAFPVGAASPAHSQVWCSHCQSFLSGASTLSPFGCQWEPVKAAQAFHSLCFICSDVALVFSSAALAVLAFLSLFPVLCLPPPKSLPVSRVPLGQHFSLSLVCNFFHVCFMPG